jgi:aminopeptidase N
VRIDADHNSSLSGLFRSKDGYFTQCEAQGFRSITWFPDRPDIMSRYSSPCTPTRRACRCCWPTATRSAAATKAPTATGRAGKIPLPSPAISSRSSPPASTCCATVSPPAAGASVQLAVFVEPGKLDQCAHAMDALQRSMRWDEEVFGLECDLDHYMIVAVGDFNMGAMENKGLNIFNTKYVLARADTATDGDYQNIDRVVAHEYFHNWTGNRVTCRDWFQLSLKEGLTVFRDQEFGADMHSRAVTRIRDVRALRAAQFPKTPARWRIRYVPTRTSRSTTSTPAPSMKRAPKWCA